MRTQLLVLGTSLLLAACSGSTDTASEDPAQGSVQSPLEATGQVQFYVKAVGAKQGQFKGESTAKDHVGELPAFRFSMGAQTPQSSTGLPTGRPQYDNIQITKAFGASDPQFLQALSTNETLTSVNIVFTKVAPTGMVYDWQQVTLTNARVATLDRSTMALDDANKTSMLADVISLTFQKLELKDLDGNTDTVISH